MTFTFFSREKFPKLPVMTHIGAFFPFIAASAPRTAFISAVTVMFSFTAGEFSQIHAEDTLVLKNGQHLQGQLRAPLSDGELVLRFRTSDGIELEIAQSEVEDIQRSEIRANSEDYAKLKAETPDTVDGNLKIAHWCAEQQMLSQKKFHYERVLELDPENETARRALGFKKMIDGQWRTSEEEMNDQGKVKYKGRWVSRQEKELLEKKTQEKIQEKKIASDIKKWVKAVGSSREENALAELENLRDPLAVAGLTDAYESEKRPAVKKILIKSLGHVGTEQALNALLQIAVDEKIEELRLTALDNLLPHKGAGVTEYFIMRLSPKTSTHDQINYAAHALGELEDQSAVPALIQALETTHKFQVTTGNQGGQTSAGMGRSSNGGGGAGLSMGSSVKTVRQKMTNPDVLEALKKLTGMNFQYDQHLWIQWYQQKTGGAGAAIRPEN